MRQGLKISRAGFVRWSRIAGVILLADAVLLALAIGNWYRHDHVAIWFLAVYAVVSFKIHAVTVLGAWQILTGRDSLYLDLNGNLVVVSGIIYQIALKDIVWIEVFEDARIDSVKLHTPTGREDVILSGYFEGGGPALLQLTGKPGTAPRS